MQYFSQIFHDTMSLFVGTNSEVFSEYQDFYHMKSFFRSEWYNYIIPKVKNPANLDMNLINRIIDNETSLGKNVSFYINETILENYTQFLGTNNYKLIGDEIYMLKELLGEVTTKLPDNYTINNQYDPKKVLSILEKCFPDWPDEKSYSALYENYKLQGQEDRGFETIVAYFNEEVIGAGSVSLDKNLNLGYLHNSGISETHRRNGLHTALVNERCNYCLKNGVNRVVSIVDENALSYPSLLKNGFTVADKFFVFSHSK